MHGLALYPFRDCCCKSPRSAGRGSPLPFPTTELLATRRAVLFLYLHSRVNASASANTERGKRAVRGYRISVSWTSTFSGRASTDAVSCIHAARIVNSHHGLPAVLPFASAVRCTSRCFVSSLHTFSVRQSACAICTSINQSPYSYQRSARVRARSPLLRLCRCRVAIWFQQSHRTSAIAPRFGHASMGVAFQGTVNSSRCIPARSTCVLRACRPVNATKVFPRRCVECKRGIHARARSIYDTIRAHASALYTASRCVIHVASS